MTFQQSYVGYRVKDSTKYPSIKTYGYKQLSRINQKQYDFKFMSAQTKFQFQIQFNVPAIINQIQIKAKFVHQVLIILYDTSKKCCEVHFVFDPLELKVYRKKTFDLSQCSAIYTRAVVKIQNFQPMATYINYLLFKGFKQRMTKKLPKQSTQGPIMKTQNLTKQKTKVSDVKNKPKEVKKTSPQQLLKEVQDQKQIKRQKLKVEEDTDFKRAIEQSKKDVSKQKNKNDSVKIKYQNQKLKQDQDQYNKNNSQQQFFEYDVTDWQKIRNTFQHVKPQWIEAQRMTQKQQNIRSRHSIAQKIKIKIFKNMQFLFIGGKQCVQLIPIIQSQCGKILQQPKNGCYIITNKNQIKLSQKFSNIKFITPQYIKQCNKSKTRLDQKLYKP